MEPPDQSLCLAPTNRGLAGWSGVGRSGVGWIRDEPSVLHDSSEVPVLDRHVLPRHFHEDFLGIFGSQRGPVLIAMAEMPGSVEPIWSNPECQFIRIALYRHFGGLAHELEHAIPHVVELLAGLLPERLLLLAQLVGDDQPPSRKEKQQTREDPEEVVTLNPQLVAEEGEADHQGGGKEPSSGECVVQGISPALGCILPAGTPKWSRRSII